MPRIAGFMAAHPDWQIVIESTPLLVDFAREDVDVGIRFGPGPWPGLERVHLMDDEYLLVASPSLFGKKPPKRIADLDRHPILRADDDAWIAWCAAAGVALKAPDTGVDYQDMGVMLQAAIEGQGVMLSRRAVAAAELEKGTLVQLFDVTVPAEAAYWLVWPSTREPGERLVAFRDWILAEAAKTAPLSSRRPPLRWK